jgi:oligoendopeptidase F
MFPAYFSAYADFRSTLGNNLYAALKEHLFDSRVRHYSSCLAAALDADNVPESVYRNLIAQVREALPVLHRYFRLRARSLGVERLEYPDLYCPLCRSPAPSYTTAQAKSMVRESLTPLGDTYLTALDDSFRSRWIDWHPGDGKRSGAYASGSAYGVHPYVLLNWNGDYDGVSTLTHEMGHALHSHFSNRTQPHPTADYTIFVAEVASTFNEALLVRRVLDTADSAETRLFVLGSYLDGIRGTLFRQTMFAEFELTIHEHAEKSRVLTGEALDEIYLDLLRQYHGHDEGVVHIADAYAMEWAAVPHFYYDFYVYQYATGIVAAHALARSVLDDLPEARERYLRFLGSGGSDYPLALLRDAGVDLQAAAPYRDTLSTVAGHLDELESLLDGRTSEAAGR